jgi:hypothetical protein
MKKLNIELMNRRVSGSDESIPSLTFLIDAFEFDVFVQAGDDHRFAHLKATGERRLVGVAGFALFRVPELTVGAVAVPAEVAVGDAAHREELEAAQQAIVLRHFDAAAENFNRHQSLVWLKQIAVNQEGFGPALPVGLR